MTLFTILFLSFIFLYIIQLFISCSINDQNNTRPPKDMPDFFLLTFLPYVLRNLEHIKKDAPPKPKKRKDVPFGETFLDNLKSFKEVKIED